jgi:hypothetical protein
MFRKAYKPKNARKLTMKYQNKTVIGLSEKIILHGDKGSKTLIARIDTGATKGSIDVRLAADLQLGPIVKSKRVKSAHGNNVRAVVRAGITIAGKRLESEFTIADRSHLKYKCLVGQNVLKEAFLIDPSKH